MQVVEQPGTEQHLAGCVGRGDTRLNLFVGQRLVVVDQPEVAEQEALAAHRDADPAEHLQVRTRRDPHRPGCGTDAEPEHVLGDRIAGAQRHDRLDAVLVDLLVVGGVGEQVDRRIVDGDRAMQLLGEALDDFLQLAQLTPPVGPAPLTSLNGLNRVATGSTPSPQR